MSNFETEYYQRLRRVAGITDDSVQIELESGQNDGYWAGGCETCNFYIEGEPYVKIVRIYDGYPYSEDLKSFGDMGELIRALDAVEL